MTGEVFAAVVVGILVGALLGTYAADRLVDALDTPLIHLTRHVDASTYAWAAGMVLVVSALTLDDQLVDASTDTGCSTRRSASVMSR